MHTYGSPRDKGFDAFIGEVSGLERSTVSLGFFGLSLDAHW